MFPKERPRQPSPERMSIVLMLKVHLHHLLLGPSPSTHVTCHCHLMPASGNHRDPAGLLCTWAMPASVWVCRDTDIRHALKAHRRAYYVLKKKSLSFPEILLDGQKVPHEKCEFFQFYHPRASCITASDIKLLFQFLIFFPLQDKGGKYHVCHFNAKP